MSMVQRSRYSGPSGTGGGGFSLAKLLDAIGAVLNKGLKGIVKTVGKIAFWGVTAAIFSLLWQAATKVYSVGLSPPGALIEPIFLAATTGAVVGWLRRGFKVKSKFGESLFSSLCTFKWFEKRPTLAVADVLTHTLIGYFVGLILAYTRVPYPLAENAHISPLQIISIVEAGGGGPPGGGDGPLSGLLTIAILVAAIVISFVVGAVIMAIVETTYIWIYVRLATIGAAKGATKEVMRALTEEGEVQGAQITESAFKGAIVGVIVGVAILFYPALK